MRSINPKIVEYIKYYASQGYSIDRIKQFLISNNISPKEVDEAITQFNQSTVPINNPTLELQIKNYIQTQLNYGYNIEVIKSALIRQGFNSNIINKVANDLNNVNINVKHEVNISKGTIIGVVAAIFIVGLIVFGVLNFSIFKPKESLMDITITNMADSYLPGENINFQIDVTNMGATQKFDSTIKYLIVDDTGKVITRKEETLAVQTTASVNRNIQLPQNILPGKYSLQAISDYGNKEATSKSEFEVVQKVAEKTPATYTPPTTSDTSTDNNTINTNTESNINNNNPSIPINTEKTFGEMLTVIRQTAKNNPESAANNCIKLTSAEQKDICYSTVADASQSYNYCDKIVSTEYKDNCYLAFVMNGNVDVCDKITDNSSKTFCQQLHLVQMMDQYSKENNTEKILELSKQFNPSIIQNTNPQVNTYEYTYNEPVSIMDIVNENTPTDNSSENVSSNGTI